MRESLYAKPACSIATAREIAELAALLPRFNLLIPAENRDVFQEEATGLLELAVQRMGSEIEAMNADLASYLGERFSANEEEAHAYNTLYRATVIDQLTRQHCKYSREAAALVAIQRQQLHQQ
ncbi:MAG: hypothetical protein Q7S05_01915 [bacterium]|nr:hypothetical protein [bacterium]